MATEIFETTTRRWSANEYDQMVALGWFNDQRVELIEGEVLHMSPQGAVHQMCIALVQEALLSAFGSGHWVRLQAPLRVGDESEPEPDLAVVPGTARDYPQHPTTALLVVEVSDTTLAYDRGRKAGLYAAAGVPEYWILDVNNRKLEVLRQPMEDPSHSSGHAYRVTVLHLAADEVSPLSAAGSLIKVASLLP